MSTTKILTYRSDPAERKRLADFNKPTFRAGAVVNVIEGPDRPPGNWAIWDRSRERNGWWLVPWDDVAHAWAKARGTSCLDVEAILLKRAL